MSLRATVRSEAISVSWRDCFVARAPRNDLFLLTLWHCPSRSLGPRGKPTLSLLSVLCPLPSAFCFLPFAPESPAHARARSADNSVARAEYQASVAD